jgi:hypothetical protein
VVIELTDLSIHPNFLYIGSARAGSSWLHEVLREHPEVYVPAAKDIQFFDRHYAKGFGWYLSFFRAGQGKRAIGEVAHDYFLSERVAGRIHEHLPGIRLLCTLREPLGQLLSSYLYRQNTVLNERVTFREFALQDEPRRLCDYYYNLLPFFELFSRDSILVQFYDDLQADPGLFVYRLLAFLDIDPSFVPTILRRRVLVAREPRWVAAAHLAYRTGAVLRKVGMANLVGMVKRNHGFQSVFSRPVDDKPVVPPDVADGLRHYFGERYKDLPELIGRELPEGWPKSQ